MGIQRWDMDGLVEYSERTGDVIGADVRHYEMEKGSYVLFADHEAILEQVGLLWAHKLVERDNEIDRLRAELAAKSKDAERYAWLRERAGQDDDFVEIFIDNESYAPGHLDAQIDSAMGEGNVR